jgi:hypothetical protein
MKSDDVVREQLLALLQGEQAHMSFDQAISGFPLEHINTRPPNVTYTPWHLLEHMRIAQRDILEFIRNPDHVSPEWPNGYWPGGKHEVDENQWQETIEAFRSDLRSLEEIAKDPQTDLYADLPHATGYNILREILVAADHNAYHIGELGVLRQVMGAW